MKRVFIFVALSFISVSAALAEGRGANFSNIECPSDEALVREILELEVSGLRVAGRKDACVAQERFPHVLAVPPHAGEAGSPSKPRYVSEEKPFEIRAIRTDEMGRLNVEFVFNVVASGKTAKVEDYMVLRRYEGHSKKQAGCVAHLVMPAHLMIKRSCQGK